MIKIILSLADYSSTIEESNDFSWQNIGEELTVKSTAGY